MPAVDSLFCRLDHLVVCASHLSQGVDWVADRCGIRLPFGGSHPLMATHNHLGALSQDTFLEIIATDPQAPEPLRKRWFSLDDAVFQRRLSQAPRLTTWVVGTRDLRAALAIAADAGIDAGEPVSLTRGDLQWEIGLRVDGSLAYDGTFPILIQWPEGMNPVSSMHNPGLRLNTLQLQHADAESLTRGLRALGIENLAKVQSATADGAFALRADMQIDTKHFTLTS